MIATAPYPFQIVTDPQQLRAFTDPLRVRILNMLKDEPATNQQIAHALGEPQAKVLYHIRFLVDVGLIRLVEQRIKGGNVEKYYRAVARLFGLRDGDHATPGIAVATLEAAQQEAAASEAAWPGEPPSSESRRGRLSPERAHEFHDRLLGLIAEYWGGPDPQAMEGGEVAEPDEDPNAPALCFTAVIYRDPTKPTP